MSQHDPLHNPYQPPTGIPYSQPAQTGDSTGGLIPYKNMPALLSYYLGIFSLIPCLGIFLGVAAFVLGLVGVSRQKANPIVKGAAHAWFGIIMGGLCAFIWTSALLFMLAKAVLSSASH